MNIRGLTVGDAGTEPVEQRGHGIQHQPLPAIAEHAHVVEDGSEEDAEGQKDLDNVLDIAEEQAGCGYDHANPHAEQDHAGEQNGNPKEVDAPTNLHEDQEDRQGGKRDEEIEEAGQHRCHGENFLGKIDFDDEFTIAGETVAGETDAGDDERPRNSLNCYAGDIRRLERWMSDHGIGVTNNNAGHDDEDGHEDSPEKAHDRLLVPDFNVAVGDHV